MEKNTKFNAIKLRWYLIRSGLWLSLAKGATSLATWMVKQSDEITKKSLDVTIEALEKDYFKDLKSELRDYLKDHGL